MRTFTRRLERYRPAWLTHTGLDLHGISATRRHIYVYSFLLLFALMAKAVEDYRDIAKLNKARAKATRTAKAQS